MCDKEAHFLSFLIRRTLQQKRWKFLTAYLYDHRLFYEEDKLSLLLWSSLNSVTCEGKKLPDSATLGAMNLVEFLWYHKAQSILIFLK